MVSLETIRDYLKTPWNRQERDISTSTKPHALRNYLLDLNDGGGEYHNLTFLVRIRLAVSHLMLRESIRSMEEIANEMDYWEDRGGEDGRIKIFCLKRLWKALAVYIGRVKVLIDTLSLTNEERRMWESSGDEVEVVRKSAKDRRMREKTRDQMMVLGKLSKSFDKALYVGGSGQVATDLIEAVKLSVQTEHSGEKDLDFFTPQSETQQERVIAEDLLYELNVLPLVCALIRNAVRPLSRPWRMRFKYTEATLAIVAGTAYLMTKSSHFGGSGDLERWISEASVSMKRFLTEHVVQPSVAIYDKIFRNTTVTTSASAESLAEERASLQRMIEDFAVEHYKEEETLKLAKKGDMLPVLRIYEKELQHPVRNLVAGSILRALLIQVQALKANVEELMTSANEQIYLNEINLQVLALFPAALVGVATVYGVSAFVSAFFSGRSRSQRASINEVARMRLHDINLVLIQRMEEEKGKFVESEPAEASSEQEEKSEVNTSHENNNTLSKVIKLCEDLGILLSKVDALEQLLSSRWLRMSKWSRAKLRKDLELIKSSLLSDDQKLKIVDSASKAYPLLR